MNHIEAMASRFVEHAPQVALVVFVAIAGVLLSWLVSRIVLWAARRSGLEALAERAGVARLLYAVGTTNGVAEILKRVAFAAGLLLTLSAVADLLHLQALSSLTQLAVQYVPRLLAAAVVLIGGIALATLVRNVVRAAGQDGDALDNPKFVSQLVYYFVLVVAVTLAADQAGLNTGFVDTLIIMVIGIGLGAVGLSFALGARTMFHQLTARHYYERVIAPGDQVSVGEDSGVAVRFTSVALILRTDRNGLIVIPCDALASQAIKIQPLADEPAAME